MQRRDFLHLLGAATTGLVLGGSQAWARDDRTATFEEGSPRLDWRAAALAWEFSQEARLDPDKLKSSRAGEGEELLHFPGPPGLALHDTQILVRQREDRSLIAYRGTESREARAGEYGKELLDLLTDLRFYQRPLGPGDKIRVHSGFFEAVEETWSFLRPLLETGKPAVFVGHSLGGALATYAAHKAHLAGYDVAEVWTFGSPRVGNPDFATAYNEALGEVTYRFANESDVIARLPGRGLSSLGPLPEYRHVGKPVVLWADGRVDSDWNRLVEDFRIEDALIRELLDDGSLASHSVYSVLSFAETSPQVFPRLIAENPPPALLQRLLPTLLELSKPETIEAVRDRWGWD